MRDAEECGMLDRIEYVSNGGSEYEVDGDLLADIHRKIEGINRLVDQFNQLPEGQPAASLLLARIYQLQKIQDDSILTRLSQLSSLQQAISRQYIDAFHKRFLPSLKEAFLDRGVLSFTDFAINQWDIMTNSRSGNIPGSREFLRSAPGTSTLTAPVFRALDTIDRTIMGKASLQNYHQLMRLKQEIGLLVATHSILKNEEKTLSNLVMTVNRQIEKVLLANPRLLNHLTPESSDVSMAIDNMPLDDLVLNIVSPVVMPDSSSSSSSSSEPEHHFEPGSDNPFTNYWASMGYSTQYLGGGNAHNILLTDSVNQIQLVVKILPCMGNATRCADRLRDTVVNNHLARLHSTRSGVQTADGRLWSVEVTEYCARGDLLSHSKSQSLPEERCNSAARIYAHMSLGLLHFTHNDALFNDMKPSNYLLNSQGQPVIADTKSFVDTPGGVFGRSRLQEDQGNLFTVGFVPPELKKFGDTSNTDKHHSFLMGISLYLYLTQKDYQDIVPDKDIDRQLISFGDPVFSTQEGKEFRFLIEGLLQESPTTRIGLLEARSRLLAIDQGIAARHTISHGAPSSASHASVQQPSAAPETSLPAKYETYRWLIIFKRMLYDHFMKAGPMGGCPDNIARMLNSTSLKEMGDFAARQVKKPKPLIRRADLHQLYGIMAQLAAVSPDVRKIHGEIKTLISPGEPTEAIQMVNKP